MLVYVLQLPAFASQQNSNSLSDWDHAQYMIPYCIAVNSGAITGPQMLQNDEALIRTKCKELLVSMSLIAQEARAEKEGIVGRSMSSERISFYNQRLQDLVLSMTADIISKLTSDAVHSLSAQFHGLKIGTTGKILGSTPINGKN
jgi:glutaminase